MTEIFDICEYSIGWDGITLVYWQESKLVMQKMKIVEPHENHSGYLMEFYQLPPMVPNIVHYMLDIKHVSFDENKSLSLTLMQESENDRLAQFAEEFRDVGMRMNVLMLDNVVQHTPGLN